MRHFSKVVYPPRECEEEVRRTCDFCGREINTEARNGYIGSENYVVIMRKTGYSCRDGGAGTTEDVDCCFPCWDEKVLPWLKSYGIIPNEKGWGW